MDVLEIEEERRLGREAAAAWLHALADTLERHNEVAFRVDGLDIRVKVPDEITMEVEVELEDAASKLEIEISW